MEITINDFKKASIFVNIFNYVKYFTDKITINIKQDQFYIQGMDNSHVCIFELKLQQSWFCQYNVNEPLELGINVNILTKILHTRDDNQNIILSQDNDEADSLTISLTTISNSDNDKQYNKIFALPLMELECELFEIPETEYSLTCFFESKKLKQIVDELSNFSDCVNITHDENDLLSMTANSEYEGTMKIDIHNIDKEIVEGEGEIKMDLSTKYLQYICNFQKLTENVNVYISDRTPLCIHYPFDETNYIRFYLAPKINDYEDDL